MFNYELLKEVPKLLRVGVISSQAEGAACAKSKGRRIPVRKGEEPGDGEGLEDCVGQE